MYCNEHNLTVSCQVCQPMAPETVMPHSQALMHGGMETGNETGTIDSSVLSRNVSGLWMEMPQKV